MNNEMAGSGKKPGIVIFAAILQFFSSALFFFVSVISGLAIFFGSQWGIDQVVHEQMAQYANQPNFTYGLTILFSVALILFLGIAIFFLLLGIGLLAGKKFAWYLQVAMSILGLLSMPLTMMWNIFVLPLGAIINIAILVLFFQQRVRSYFKV